MTDITVVTGFYDIGRGNWGTQYSRSLDTYFGYFETLAALKNPMVICTSADLADRVMDARKRHGLHSLTDMLIRDLPHQERTLVHQNIAQPIFRNFVLNKEIP